MVDKIYEYKLNRKIFIQRLKSHPLGVSLPLFDPGKNEVKEKQEIRLTDNEVSDLRRVWGENSFVEKKQKKAKIEADGELNDEG